MSCLANDSLMLQWLHWSYGEEKRHAIFEEHQPGYSHNMILRLGGDIYLGPEGGIYLATGHDP
jgi:hypothetical protein